MKYSSAINNFTKEFGSILAAQLKITSGDINKINQIDIPQSVRPIFNGLFNKFNGLQILVNDTEQTEVYLKNYQIDTNGNWEAEIVIEITDHFGLDKNDALNYQYKHSGFGAWWTLQFKRDYKPFITKIHVGKIIKGKI